MQKINIPLKRINNKNDLPLPTYATVLSSGADLYADIDDDIVLKTGHYPEMRGNSGYSHGYCHCFA